MAAVAPVASRSRRGRSDFLKRDPELFILFIEFWSIAVRDEDIRRRQVPSDLIAKAMRWLLTGMVVDARGGLKAVGRGLDSSDR